MATPVQLGDTDAHDPLRAHGLPVSEVEHTWAEPGPLGLQLKAQDWVGGRPEIAELQRPELARVLAVGMTVLEINGEPLGKAGFEQTVEQIRSAARPLTIKFRTPPESLMKELYRKYWKGEFTEEELRGWLVVGLGLPIPLSSFVTKAITGGAPERRQRQLTRRAGRTPTVADPLLMMVGLDNFWSGQNVSQFLLSHADQLPVRPGLEAETERGQAVVATASQGGVSYFEHTWSESGGLGLRLEAMGEVQGVERGARVQARLEDTLPSELTAGMVLVEINGDDVTSTAFSSILSFLRAVERPVTIRFANVFAAQAAMWAWVYATFGT